MLKAMVPGLRYFMQAAILLIACGLNVPAQCGASLDEETIQSLSFGIRYPSLEFQSGQTAQLQLYKLFGGVEFVPLDPCVVWSVSRNSFVTLDSKSGLLKIEPGTPNGTTFIVTASIESGRRILAIPAYVYRPEDNPLIGIWTETERFSCDSGKRISVTEPIREVVFRADGKMYVSRFLFENIFDFQAAYLFDRQSGDFAFVIDQANFTPFDVEGFGRYRINGNGSLILHKLSLGRFSRDEKQACKYEFGKIDGSRAR